MPTSGWKSIDVLENSQVFRDAAALHAGLNRTLMPLVAPCVPMPPSMRTA